MSCWKHGGPGRWYYSRRRRNEHCGEHEAQTHHGNSSGNAAFDAYREETLKRLEDEQNEFESFLEQLRHAKDKAEFDQFMDDRKGRPQRPPENPSGGDQDQPGA